MDYREAKEMWCPWRPLEYVSNGRGIANHRIDDGYALGTNSRCIAYECMAWRDGDCARLAQKESK